MKRLDEKALLDRLGELGVEVTLHRHPPLFTVDESQAMRGELPGAHCKNMFLKAKSGDLVLVTCREDRKIRIRDLEKEIGLRKLSFGKPELLEEVLGITPGAVTPMGLFNDTEKRVRFVLDAQMLHADILNCHPLHNEATIAISTSDLGTIWGATGHTPTVLDFDALEAKAAAVA